MESGQAGREQEGWPRRAEQKPPQAELLEQGVSSFLSCGTGAVSILPDARGSKDLDT